MTHGASRCPVFTPLSRATRGIVPQGVDRLERVSLEPPTDPERALHFAGSSLRGERGVAASCAAVTELILAMHGQVGEASRESSLGRVPIEPRTSLDQHAERRCRAKTDPGERAGGRCARVSLVEQREEPLLTCRIWLEAQWTQRTWGWSTAELERGNAKGGKPR